MTYMSEVKVGKPALCPTEILQHCLNVKLFTMYSAIMILVKENYKEIIYKGNYKSIGVGLLHKAPVIMGGDR